MHRTKIMTSGKDLAEATKALIMIHGRGASATDILSLAPELHVSDFALLAPEATNSTWYPLSFLAPPEQNEPWLSSAITLVNDVVSKINNAGIPNEHIYFLGFSQGACLTLEYVTRHAKRWGGVTAFTGGLIGDRIYAENYQGDFAGTPVFIGTSDPDPHIPVVRVTDTAKILKEMNASVSVKIYKNVGHTVSYDEIGEANRFIFK